MDEHGNHASQHAASAASAATAVAAQSAVPKAVRIGDADRERALAALAEHCSAGRLDTEEYGERSARIVVARTSDSLAAEFHDLPEPSSTPSAESSAVPCPAKDRPLPQRIAAGALPFSVILAMVLFFALGHPWWVFALPALVGMFGNRFPPRPVAH